MSINKMERLVGDAFDGRMSTASFVDAFSARTSAPCVATAAAGMNDQSSVSAAAASSPFLVPTETLRAAKIMKRLSDEHSVAALRSVHDCKLTVIQELHELVNDNRAAILSSVEVLVNAAQGRILPPEALVVKAPCLEVAD
jgi:hypothetical protein